MDTGTLLRDLTYGLRLLRKSPGFSVLAVLTLALGIGAATSVFSLVNAVLLRSLPYQDPDRLLFVFEANPRIPGVPLDAWGAVNADFYDWQKQSRSFTSLALFTTNSMNLSTEGAAVRVAASRVTGEFFQTLGISPELGRAVSADDDQPGKGQVAVISHALWQSQFASDRAVVGKQLQLDARPYRIIGVMPAGFAFPHGSESIETHGGATDIWVPLALTPQQRASRGDDPGSPIGRLRPGVTPGQAQAELNALTAPVDKLHPPFLQGSEVVVRPFDTEIVGTSRRILLILMAAVFLVLLIACSNVAGLVLARAHGRTLEIGVRTALGASRGRLVRQLLVEALCLGGGGGLLGILVAYLAVHFLVYLNPGNVPRMEETTLDVRVMLFAVCLSVATAVLFGLFPALATSRCNLHEVLKNAANRSVRKGTGRLQRGLTIAQVALTFVLLTGSGLLIRSFLNLQSVDKGFVTGSTVAMNIHLDGRYRSAGQQIAFFRAVLEKTGALPGVEAAAAITHAPLSGGQALTSVNVQGYPPDDKLLVEVRTVSPRYFATMGIPLLAGREFSVADTADQPPVVIVSRGFALKYFPGRSAIGQHVGMNRQSTIVGVVADVRQYDLESAPPVQIYGPLWQNSSASAFIVARTRIPPDRLASAMRAVMRDLDPAVALADVRTMNQLLSQSTSGRRFQTVVLTAFGGVAFFLSLVGLYGLMACLVEQRTAEMGIRLALGAQPGSILLLVLKQGSGLALSGITLGFACAWILTRSIAGLLFQVTPTDVPTFAAVAVTFGAVALAACYFPARRATRTDPMIALKSD